MSDLIKVNPEMMQSFSGFIKEKYSDGVIWDGGNPTHPMFLDLWCSFIIGWQASANREGFVLVPVEPSEEMLMAMQDGFEFAYEESNYDSRAGYESLIKTSQENKDE